MPAAVRDRVTVVWLALVLATVLSWAVGTEHGFEGTTATALLIMAIAFLKIRYIAMYFMELRDAPVWLRYGCEAYCAVAFGAVAVAYLLT